MGDRNVQQIEHATGSKVVDIPDAGTNSLIFGMNTGPILALYYAAPDVDTHLKAQSKETPNGTFRTVKKPDGTDWTYPTDASDITTAGVIGANSFADFVGIGEVRFVAQAAQTNGWPMTVRVTG